MSTTRVSMRSKTPTNPTALAGLWKSTLNPSFHPAKRTALGRAAHEGATVAMTKDGRAVVYIGKNHALSTYYQLVSRDTMKPSGATANATLLDHGTLSVLAEFNADGKGQWGSH